jgi:hypothetical protein
MATLRISARTHTHMTCTPRTTRVVATEARLRTRAVRLRVAWRRVEGARGLVLVVPVLRTLGRAPIRVAGRLRVIAFSTESDEPVAVAWIIELGPHGRKPISGRTHTQTCTRRQMAPLRQSQVVHSHQFNALIVFLYIQTLVLFGLVSAAITISAWRVSSSSSFIGSLPSPLLTHSRFAFDLQP